MFAVASQGQHSPEMCHSAAVLEWGKLNGELCIADKVPQETES